MSTTRAELGNSGEFGGVVVLANLDVTSSETDNTTTEQTLMTYTIPANTLNSQGLISLEGFAVGGFADNANAKTARLYIGTPVSAFAAWSPATISGSGGLIWTVHYKIFGTVDEQFVAFDMIQGRDATTGETRSLPGVGHLEEDGTTALDIRITGQTDTADSPGDVIVIYHRILVMNATI